MDCRRTRATNRPRCAMNAWDPPQSSGGAAHFPSHARRVNCSRVDGQRRFRAQVVNLTVPEITFVNKSLESAEPQIAESHAPGIDADHAAALPIHRVLAAPGSQSGSSARRSHRRRSANLFVKLGHRAIVAHQEPPPDHRADAVNHCAQLIDLCIRFCYALRLGLCAAPPQLSVALDILLPTVAMIEKRCAPSRSRSPNGGPIPPFFVRSAISYRPISFLSP